MRTIPININIHIEPEGYFIGENENHSFKGFEIAAREIQKIRSALHQQNKSFKVQWLLRLDNQIKKVYGSIDWSLHEYGQLIRELKSEGDEIGIHLHSYQWDDKQNRWLVDYTDQAYINSLVDQAIEAYGSFFNHKPRIFSMGDTWINNATMNHLEDAGIKFELSPVPGRKMKRFPSFYGDYKGDPMDYQNVVSRPYMADRKDFCREDSSRENGIWVVPLTSGNWNGLFYKKEALRRIIKTRSVKNQLLKIDKFQIRAGINHDSRSFLNRIEDASTSHFAFECRTELFSTSKGLKSFIELVDFFSDKDFGVDLRFTNAHELVEIYQQSQSKITFG